MSEARDADADVESGPFCAGGDPAEGCSGGEEAGEEAVGSACRRLCSCGKMIAMGWVISEDACTQRFETRLHDL